jgi:putative PIN family toxin of toxin-antitoxin system
MLVFDTNIWVAALSSRNGASFQLLERATEGQLSYALSVALSLEYEDVLKRDAIRGQSWATDLALEKTLDLLMANAAWIMPIRTRLRPTLKDPSDDMVLECAVQCGASTIVTMNERDFRPATALYRFALETPGECLNRIRMGEVL